MAEIAIVMGSDSDWRIMEQANSVVMEFGFDAEIEVLSAHRTPEKMLDWAKKASSKGIKVIIAGAGGGDHLPGTVPYTHRKRQRKKIGVNEEVGD